MKSLPIRPVNLRCCCLCSFIKTANAFEEDGCDNCETFLHLKGNRSRVNTCTTTNYYGIISMMDPKESWVASECGLQFFQANFVPGCYAISVAQKLDERMIEDLAEDGIQILNRDKSLQPD